MNWSSIKGIATIMDFPGYYLENGAINKNRLFLKPDREKFGYLWDVSPEYIQGIEKNVGENIVGILITNDVDARVVLGLFNSIFYKMNTKALLAGVQSYILRPNTSKKPPTRDEMDKAIWLYYYEILKTLYSSDYTPLKKYLSQPVKNKIWVPIFREFSGMDKIARKGYYQFLKWIIGSEAVILELPNRYDTTWIWEEVINGDGPMENPETIFLQEFSVAYPGSIKYMPKSIVDKIGVDPLGDLDFFGIRFPLI